MCNADRNYTNEVAPDPEQTKRSAVPDERTLRGLDLRCEAVIGSEGGRPVRVVKTWLHSGQHGSQSGNRTVGPRTKRTNNQLLLVVEEPPQVLLERSRQSAHHNATESRGVGGRVLNNEEWTPTSDGRCAHTSHTAERVR